MCILGEIVWNSTLCDSIRTNNPLNPPLAWLGKGIEVNQGLFWLLILFSIVSAFLILTVQWPIQILKAVYFTPNKSEDVTERIRRAFEDERLRSIPVTNDFILGIGKDIDYGVGKKLTVDFSRFGIKYKKTVDESERFRP